MRIGIFGGSFNPIHKGHIQIVLTAIKELELDKIFVVPVGIPSHKEGLAPGEDRMKMCELAFESPDIIDILRELDIQLCGNDLKKKIEISDLEIEQSEISYTYNTLMMLKSKAMKENSKLENKNEKNYFFEIIGEDSARKFHTWMDYEKILKESTVVVFPRKLGEVSLEPLPFREMIRMNTPYFPYSSSEIRLQIQNCKKFEKCEEYDIILRNMLVYNVIKYVKDKKMYEGN